MLYSHEVVENSTGDSKWCEVLDWWGVWGVCEKCPDSVKAHCRKLGLSGHNGTKCNNLVFLKNILNFSSHPISKACSGCLIFGQSISLVGQARDKLRDSSISQPSYNMLYINMIRLYKNKGRRADRQPSFQGSCDT